MDNFLPVGLEKVAGSNIFFLFTFISVGYEEKWEAKGFVDQVVGALSEFAMPVFSALFPHTVACAKIGKKRHPPRALFSD